LALLEIEGLRKSFGGLTAVDGVDLALEEGSLHALVGPNGCGKSTLFNLITGALAPSGGRVRFAGDDITGWPVHRIARAGIGRKFQVPAVFDELSVLENLCLPRWSKGRLPLLTRADLSAGEDQLARIHLAAKSTVRAGALSHGERQWLEIGMLLAAKARLLLLDEPTAGMTQAETAATAGLIRSVAGSATVLVIEHDIGFIEALGCPVTVMARGRILCSGSFAEVRADARVRELYLGRAA
jgi:urea transport system ATP-binding protein